LGGSTLDSADLSDATAATAAASAAWSIGRAVGGRSFSSIGEGGIGVGSTNGPWPTAGEDDSDAAAPFARWHPSPNGDATGNSGLTSGEAMLGDELLLPGGSTGVPALLDLLGAGEVG
jgi:hypothetical protein